MVHGPKCHGFVVVGLGPHVPAGLYPRLTGDTLVSGGHRDGKGLDARVAASWQRVLCQALSNNKDDTPFNRGIIAEMEQEAADPESWPPSPPRTPESAGSWEQDRDEALAYRTRDEAAAEESSSSPSL